MGWGRASGPLSAIAHALLKLASVSVVICDCRLASTSTVAACTMIKTNGANESRTGTNERSRRQFGHFRLKQEPFLGGGGARHTVWGWRGPPRAPIVE